MGLSFYRCRGQLSRTCVPKLSCDYFNQICLAKGKMALHRLKCFWNDQKKSSHFGQNVWKNRLINTGLASCETKTTARQMTEMFQWPKCLSKKNNENQTHAVKKSFEDEKTECLLVVHANNALNKLNRKVSLENIKRLSAHEHLPT